MLWTTSRKGLRHEEDGAAPRGHARERLISHWSLHPLRKAVGGPAHMPPRRPPRSPAPSCAGRNDPASFDAPEIMGYACSRAPVSSRWQSPLRDDRCADTGLLTGAFRMPRLTAGA